VSHTAAAKARKLRLRKCRRSLTFSPHNTEADFTGRE
jgi:hypothetical protein